MEVNKSKQQHRVLILTDEISPPAFSPRIVSLCHYLHKQGWHCIVCSDKMPNMHAFSNDDADWYHIQFYKHQQSGWKYLADKVFNARERELMSLVENKVDVVSCNLIFCSTYYYFPLQTASKLAYKYNKPLMVDLRDIAEQWGSMSYMTKSLPLFPWLTRMVGKAYERHFLRIRNDILRQATVVSSVSQWHVTTLKAFNPNTHLIYNGFDTADFYPQAIKADKFIITYTGRIYDTHFRDPRLVMQALEELLQDGRMSVETLQLVFHIEKTIIPDVEALVRQYHIEEICDIQPYIPKSELLPLLQSSSIVLVLTCLSRPDGPFGILGTKIFEAIGVEKPVLCVRSDESALAELIAESNAGLAACSMSQVKEFLLEKYGEWQQCGYTRQAVNKEVKQCLTREYESEQFERYFRDCAGL